MIDKIKTLIAKIKTRIKYNLCFRDMEIKGVAVFSMCSGKHISLWGVPAYLEQCKTCPYFTPVDDSEVDTE